MLKYGDFNIGKSGRYGMNSVYQKICSDNVKSYGTESSRVMNIIINQYSDRTHFIYEILQNAEDADATRIKFKLYKDHLEVIHNGRLFNERDIVGVCGIADGTKEDGSRIGHFGIGFKSVYGYTLTPEIYSGQYNFIIETQLFPKETPRRVAIDELDTCIYLPFNKPEVSAQIAYDEIKEALEKKITAESIIILDKIEDVVIEIEGSSKRIEINKQKRIADNECPENVFEVNLMTSHINTSNGSSIEQDSDYILFTDAEPEAVSVVFLVDGKNIKPVKNSKIYAFFPTAKEAHQNFYIHAPFDTTPARDNFKEGADFGRHNIELIRNVGEVIRFAFTWFRDKGYLSLQTLNTVFPIYKYAEDDILYYIYENSVEMLREKEYILPTNNGAFHDITEVCISENMNITEVIDDYDLQALSGNRKIYWLSKEIATTAYIGLKKFLDENFKLKSIDWRDLVPNMNQSYLQSKDKEWMERLFNRIESYCSASAGGRRIKVDTVPFVRLQDGTHICAKQNGKAIVYLNNPAVCKLKIHNEFLKSDIIKKFYQYALGVQEYNIVSETVDRLLPKYSTENVAFVTDNPIKENIEDLNEIRTAMQIDSDIKEQAKNCYIVMSEEGKWCKPAQVHINNPQTREECVLVKDIIEIHYLAHQYVDDTVMNISLDERFFKAIGCSSGLSVETVTQEEYLRTLSKYCGSEKASNVKYGIFNKSYQSSRLNWQHNYEGFPEVFKNMTFKKSLLIAKFINRNMRNIDIQGEIIGADDKNFLGKNVDSETIYSMLGLQLAYEKWIYVANEEEPQRPIDLDKAQLREEYYPFTQLLNHLPFKQASNVITEFIKGIMPEGADQEAVIRCMNGMFSNPDDLVRMAKSWEQNEAKKGQKKSKETNIKDLIQKGDVVQQHKEDEDFGDVNSISPKAIDRREKKLEEELKASLDQDVRIQTGLSFTIRPCGKEEREFLQMEYEGRCQVCDTKIEKHDGNPYFEAINIIKQTSMDAKYSNALEIGWNTLCLCPNCAAQYNYSSKKISTLYDQVMSADVEGDEWIDLEIEMPIGYAKRIRYSPRHIIAVKKAFEVFDKSNDN